MNIKNKMKNLIRQRERIHKIRMKEMTKKHVDSLRSINRVTGEYSVLELQSLIGRTKSYQLMFNRNNKGILKKCSFRTKYWVTRYLSDNATNCISNEEKVFDETQKTSWVDYLQDSINKINSNQLDYLLHEEYGFTKEKSIHTLKYLISKYRCNIYSFDDDKLGYNIASFPNYDYEKHLEGTTILSVVKTILGFPMTLIRKLILKRKWRKQ